MQAQVLLHGRACLIVVQMTQCLIAGLKKQMPTRASLHCVRRGLYCGIFDLSSGHRDVQVLRVEAQGEEGGRWPWLMLPHEKPS